MAKLHIFDSQAHITTIDNDLWFDKQAAPGSSARQIFHVVDIHI